MSIVPLALPLNRMVPRRVDSPIWALSATMFAQIVRIAPKEPLPVAPGTVVKLLRGETTEVPTPLAACKCARSCITPRWIRDVRAGAEASIVLVCWRAEAGTPAAAEGDAAAVHPVAFAPSESDAALEQSNEIVRVTEGGVFVCDVRFCRLAAGSAATGITRYDKPEDGIFGEVRVAIEGNLAVEWWPAAGFPKPGEPLPPPRVIRMPAGFEHGPLHSVDGEGELVRLCSGQLEYAPHRIAAADSAGPQPVWASVRFPQKTSEVAGPHRHCYT